MTIDYKALSEENTRKYGTEVARWAPQILANNYDSRLHFLFELLQNAEDALQRRQTSGSKTVAFRLAPRHLEFSHDGKPFDRADVQGICGIGESTKAEDLTKIGRFGIGFKSVYNITTRPEIHSPGEHFAIENFVHPVGVEPQPHEPGQTVFLFPFLETDDKVRQEIATGLEELSARSLLFLKEIEEISWEVEGAASGHSCREVRTNRRGLREVTLLWEGSHSEGLREEQWLIFSRPTLHSGKVVGAVEIAFKLKSSADQSNYQIELVIDPKLVVFFPTMISTGMGFVFQAPFQTTPSRDNVPAKETWNQSLIEEMGSLLVETLKSLREKGWLSVEVLQGLPIEPEKFADDFLFKPIYTVVAEALRTRPLLPTFEGDWKPSTNVLLARGQGLRELLSSVQLAELFGLEKELFWLHKDITAVLTPDLYSYLRKEHNVREIVPETFFNALTKEFLERQSDDWIIRLYRFLLDQPSLLKSRNFALKPLVRLENGDHVVVLEGGQQVFLPTEKGESGFSTVKRVLCDDPNALKFLEQLGLTQPDPVDDVIANILPHYTGEVQHPSLDLYKQHLKTVLNAFDTPNSNQKNKLISELKNRSFMLTTTSSDKYFWTSPSDCYLPTDRLTQLFEGVEGVYFVDRSIEELQGEAAGAFLIACGVARYLYPEKVKGKLSDETRNILRKNTTCRSESVEDHTLRGLDGILLKISTLPFEEAVVECNFLWNALIDVVRDRRDAVLTGTYFWSHYGAQSAPFPAKFVRTLKKANWIPTATGSLMSPTEAVFEHLPPEWTPNPALQKALGFKPPIAEMLARELGIDPQAIDLMRQHHFTVEQLQSLIPTIKVSDPVTVSPTSAKQTSPEDHSEDASPHRDLNPPRTVSISSTPAEPSERRSPSVPSGSDSASRPAEAGREMFISYVAVSPVQDEEGEPESGQTRAERMDIEAAALDYILSLEKDLQRTPTNNPGFDLFATGEDGQTERWVEVKALKGTLKNHPAGMSRRQFLTAQEKGVRYWLYIVENALSETPILHRIQDPAGHARTFTFGRGWEAIAETTQIDVTTGEILMMP